MSYDLHDIAYLFNGEIVGDQVSFPGPGHSAKDRSARFMIAPERKEGFIVHSYSPDTTDMELKRHVEKVLGGEVTFTPAPRGTPEDDQKKLQRALRIWAHSFDPKGTPVEKYLNRRRLSLPPEANSAIRWVPACPFGPDKFVPAMVCLIRHVREDIPLGIHRTAITHEGEKAFHTIGDGKRPQDRMIMGSGSDGAIKIGKPTDTLGIGEGLESTLSLRAFKGLADMPVWSLISANGVSGFPVLDGIKTLWVAEDNDEAGRKAVASLFKRWVAAEREVNPLTPPNEGEDLNDLIRKGGVDG
ncbi:toprim domain-containing protein [Microvirga aerilata]|uniref:Toprim domain-containing protein n=1 Tax=Microvirga aerilata TaxID=670292 RepID=A0A937CXV2_9HYPH|nr:toprim domain-containing protein [Microvirga aerilata]MBL0404699.1 toprim domain-containing protein [Microvirga aerilata]